MQTHQKLPLITCVHYDLFQKAGYLCYCFNGSRTQFPLQQSVSQSFGNHRDCGRLPGSNSPCRLQVWWRPSSHSWDRGVVCLWGRGACTWGGLDPSH